MEVTAVHQNNTTYLAVAPGQLIIQTEADAVDIMGLCYDHNTDRVLLHDDNLAPDFFDLSSRVAGHILQKFRNYSVKVAVVLSPKTQTSSQFGNFMVEESRGSDFGIFKKYSEAVAWLTSDNNDKDSISEV